MKNKKGLIIGLVVFLLVIAAGAVVGLGMAGVVNIPGLTKKKVEPKKKEAKKIPAKAPTPTPEELPKPAPVPKPTFVVDAKLGATKVAELWNEVPTENLLKLVAKWKPAELARVFSEMKPKKVGEVLSQMDASKASNISRELQAIASKVPLAPES